MPFKLKYLPVVVTLVNIIIIACAIYYFSQRSTSKQNNKIVKSNQSVLGKITEIFISPTPVPPTITPTITPTATPIPHTISFTHVPTELTQGNLATFNWWIAGPDTTIRTTTVYLATISTPGLLTVTVNPTDTRYTQNIKDFMDGTYNIPLQFIASIKVDTPGTYFIRAYALIGTKHYWSNEQEIVVKEIPRNEITVLDYPGKIKKGENAPFTWEITGPQATTGYTVIVGGKESKSGNLDETIDIPHTPYTEVFMKDFTAGTYNVPLRFVGNSTPRESGVHYFRAYAYINNKHVWSAEYSLTVE